jgi:hypothetical protein
VVLLAWLSPAAAQIWISEVLINPPGTDLPHEYVELRGTPNTILPAGTYFVAVEGDSSGNPGTVQNVFDLSHRAIGGNGFLVLLQHSNGYAFHTNCAPLISTNGSGFGGSSGPPRHRGENGQTDLENNSVTFLLIQSSNVPLVELDIDANNDGTPDGAFTNWLVFDSVAVLDNDGAGDIGYGKINFRRSASPGAGATVTSGTIVPLGFTPIYVARAGHSISWPANAWVASGGLTGTAPNWSLDTDTEPGIYSARPLNHVGAPNFGASTLPGVVARETGFATTLVEGSSATDTYFLALGTTPSGPVTVRLSASAQVQVSIDAGATFGALRHVTLSNTAPVPVQVRVLDDTTVSGSPHAAPIVHSIVATGDSANYPITALGPVVNAQVWDNDMVLLSELKVNPPGPDDAPFEFIELRGAPNLQLENLYLIAVEGNKEANLGTATTVISLSGERLGSSGLLLVAADGNPYTVPSGARVLLSAELARTGGALGNGSFTLLLVGSMQPIASGADLDLEDEGVLDGLPFAANALDSVGWLDGGNNDRVYSTAALSQPSGTPDAATRYPGNTNAHTAAAWVFGNLEGTNGMSLAYAEEPTVPYGTVMTPGGGNNTAPKVEVVSAASSVIGDNTTPPLSVRISDAESPLSALTITVTSGNGTVVPDANLVLSGTGTNRWLTIQPLSVGYSTLFIAAHDGEMTGLGVVRYAASTNALGGGRYHSGASDASTALPLGPEHMLVADDENQILRIFSRSNSTPALVEFNMNPFLNLLDLYDDGTPRELDFEGSTRVGNRIYWIGSHSHSRDLDIRTNRARIFATDIAGTGTNVSLTYVGRYEFLKLDLVAWDSTNGHGRGSNYLGLAASGAPDKDSKALDGSGFNIEGLAMAPGSSNVAYVGFRAPLVPPGARAKALIVPITNFATLAITNTSSAGAAQFGAPIELNLGGRGIRSMEGNRNGYLIVAGPPGLALGTPPSDFRLFTWNGSPGSPAQERGAVIQRGSIPEAIVELPPPPWTSNSTVQLINDNGITIYYGDGIEAKFLPLRPHKKFRSDWITLGAVVPSQPVIRDFSANNSSVVLTWFSVAGTTYRVQWKSSLTDANWNNVAGDVLANDALASKTIPWAPGQRFFRVIVP